ncbi:MAG: hypothetical protein BMS9Abin37_0511 [Acidobacteriota bacterium]|nr:MAG: hypothetical protein BMS9Abin37_0511 [Acidobacteriota bacterium]
MTSRLLFRLGFLASAVLTAAVSWGQVSQLEQGQTLFTDICYRCHALSAIGGRSLAPPIQTMSMARFAAGVWNQSHSMFSAFEAEGWKPPSLTQAEMSSIFLFTQVIAENPQKGDAELGRRFVESNRCLACHSVGGGRNRDAMALDRFAYAEHPGIVMSAIWSHRRDMVSAFRDIGLPPPSFRRGDLANLVAYFEESGTPSVAAPLLMDLKAIRVDPELFASFKCNQCHTPKEFAGRPERSHEDITEALLAHAFMPVFDRPPLSRLTLSASDSMSLTMLVSYYGRFDLPGRRELGEAVFQRHDCVACHDLPGEPDPDSDKVLIGEIHDEWDFVTRIFNKVPLMLAKSQLESKAFPRLSPDEMRHLFAYLCEASSACQPIIDGEAATRP